MTRNPTNLNPDRVPAAVRDALIRLGANIATARINRHWRQVDLAAKAGVSRPVIIRVEAGHPGVGIGAYVAVLWAMGLHLDVAEVASPARDLEGQSLAAARVGTRVRLPTDLDDDF